MTTRHSLISVLLAAALLPLTLTMAAEISGITLLADYRVNPLGIDRFPVQLSWRVDDHGRTGAAQSAYRIQSASSREALLDSKTVWDTGRVESKAAWQVPYAGPALKKGERIWWRVKVWDEKGAEGEWSAPAWFEAGLLDDTTWKTAPWISCDRDFSAPEPVPAKLMGSWITAPNSTPFVSFFKDVTLPDKPVVSAMAYWGQSKPSAAGVVVDYEKSKKNKALDTLMRGSKGGFADLAFLLKPGASNRIELRFKNPAKSVTATIGMKIVFADGEEMLVQSGDGWQVLPAGKGGAPVAVKVVAPYGDPKFGEAKAFKQTSLPPAWFRGTLQAHEGIRRARLYLCALGQGLAYVNGEPVSDELLAPPQSDYEAFAYYTTHDITSLLKPGPNALAVLLDGGWYHQVGGFKTVLSYGRPGLKALAVIEYADGRQETFTSGPDWQWKEGAIRAANIYLGEQADFRRDHDEWKQVGDGQGWKAAQVIPPCTPKTVAMDVLPVRRGAPIQPVKRWQIGPRTWLFDMGEVMFGWVRFTIHEPAGTSLRLRYSEYAKDGKMENVPLSQWWCHGKMQGDEAVADGKTRVFEPTFTTKSFRYVEVSGVSAPPEDFVGVPVQSTAQLLATFESSDPMVNRLFQNGMRTWRNYVAFMTADVPRERCLWGAESIYSEVPGSYCYDYPTNHRLMLDLWCTGAMTPQGIPGNIGVGKRMTTSTSSYAWSVTPVFIAFDLLVHYGDIEAARPHYELLRRTIRYAEEKGERGGTIPVPHNIGDHAPPKDVARNPASLELVNALIFFEAENRFAHIADALGKPDDAMHARAHAEKVRATIMSFYDKTKHTFGNGTHDSLALAYGVIENAAEQQKLAASLVGWYRANGHQFDGGFMSHEIYPQLSRFGYVDDAVKILTNTEPPGPARTVKVYDATTFWEAYYLDHDFQMNRGLDFIAYSHSIGWMLTDLAGIRYESPALKPGILTLAPVFPSSLDHAAATVEIPSGIVRSTWKKESDTIHWNVTVPWNTTATVKLPQFQIGMITLNGKLVEKNEFTLPTGEWVVILKK